MNAIDLAHSILDMEEELARLRNENKRLRWFEEEYHKLLRDSLRYGEKMVANTLKLWMTPGVGEALARATGERP